MATAVGVARQGLAQAALAAIWTRAGRRTIGQGDAPAGSIPELRAIVGNNMLAPDIPNRMIFIKDTSERIAQMKKVIATLDVPTPQVLIEGRIVEASRNWARGLGVLWGGRNNQNGPIVDGKTTFWGITGNQAGAAANTATGATTVGNDIPSRFAVNLPATVTGLGNLMGLGMQFGLLGTQYITELDMRINLGEHADQSEGNCSAQGPGPRQSEGQHQEGKHNPLYDRVRERDADPVGGRGPSPGSNT